MQRIDFLLKENKKDFKVDSLRPEAIKIKHEQAQSKPEEKGMQENTPDVVAGKFEFFTGLAWCQTLLYKSWIEASDKLVKLRAERVDDTAEISSLYVDVHEDVFTNLFKSQLYASNLGKMINASMLMMKNWQNPTSSSNSDNARCLNKNK